MSPFYVSVIFIGITLIVISLVWIAYDRKKAHDYLGQIDAKKEELVGIINDAEQMIEEMNKFSDYIVTQMELKNEEMCANIKTLEERVKHADSVVEEVSEIKVVKSKTEKVVNGSSIDIRLTSDSSFIAPNYGSDMVIENIHFDSVATNGYQTRAGIRGKDKVIPINCKHKEVIQLAQLGMNDTEIAKSLKMGKGEVQLILGMNK
jgi:hypothetical protein